MDEKTRVAEGGVGGKGWGGGGVVPRPYRTAQTVPVGDHGDQRRSFTAQATVIMNEERGKNPSPVRLPLWALARYRNLQTRQ